MDRLHGFSVFVLVACFFFSVEGVANCSTFSLSTCLGQDLYLTSETVVCSNASCSVAECCVQLDLCQGLFSDCLALNKSLTALLVGVSGSPLCPNDVCNTSTCCVARTCQTNPVACGNDSVSKPNLATVPCFGATCTTSDCCQPRGSCSTFSENLCLGVNMSLTASQSKLCSATVCQIADCCEAVPTCQTHPVNCSTGFTPRLNPNDIGCASSSCSVSECCEAVIPPTCGSWNETECSILGKALVPDFSNKTCAATTCTSSECCFTVPALPNCATNPVNCTTHPAFSNASTIVCSSSGCTLADCCALTTCGSFDDTQCSAANMTFTQNFDHVCNGAACTINECCSTPKLCSSLTTGCSSGTILDPGLLCSNGTCTAAECCIEAPSCPEQILEQQCTSLNLTLASNGWCRTSTCSVQECCEAASSPSTCGSHPVNCTLGYVSKPQPDQIYCASSVCSISECCSVMTCQYYFSGTTCDELNMTLVSDNRTCTNSLCTAAECCEKPQCSDFPLSSCLAQGLYLTSDSVVCSGATCTASACCVPLNLCLDFFTQCQALNKSLATVYSGSAACPGDVCNTSTCCVGMTCQSNPVACGNNSISKINPATIPCFGATCTTTDCCEARKRCSTFNENQCVISNLSLTSNLNKFCASNDCTTADCCEAVPTCQTHPVNCSIGFAPRPDVGGILCDSAGCSVQVCCQAVSVSTCASFNATVCIAAGKILVSDLSKNCTGTCTATECCSTIPVYPTCISDPVNCTNGNVALTHLENIQCLSGHCTTSDCCLQSNLCGTFNETQCGALNMTLTSDLNRVCSGAVCGVADCCNGVTTCTSFTSQCPSGMTPVTQPFDVPCPNGTCTATQCCQDVLTCADIFVDEICALSNRTLVGDAATRVCANATCSSSQCCEPVNEVTCANHPVTCPSGSAPLSNPATHVCGGDTCTVGECCIAWKLCSLWFPESACITMGLMLTLDDNRTCNSSQCSAAQCCDPDPTFANCQGQWGPLSLCSQTCGGGQANDVFVVEVAAIGAGQACEATNGTTRTRTCNTYSCEAQCTNGNGGNAPYNTTCSPSFVYQRETHQGCITVNNGDVPWCATTADYDVDGQWGNCKPCSFDACSEFNNSCGNCTDQSNCGWCASTSKCMTGSIAGPATANVCSQWKWVDGSCASAVNCSGSFVAQSSCSKSCGTGSFTEKFVVSTSAVNGGAACDHPDGYTRSASCNTALCPVNCVASFVNGSCSRSCGTGSLTQTYRITKAAVGTGIACLYPNGTTHTTACNWTPCPAYCSGYTCGTGTVAKNNSASRLCASTVCTSDECCDVVNKCSLGSPLPQGYVTISCAGLQLPRDCHVKCAHGYYGAVSVQCQTDNSVFAISGCSAFSNSIPSTSTSGLHRFLTSATSVPFNFDFTTANMSIGKFVVDGGAYYGTQLLRSPDRYEQLVEMANAPTGVYLQRDAPNASIVFVESYGTLASAAVVALVNISNALAELSWPVPTSIPGNLYASPIWLSDVLSITLLAADGTRDNRSAVTFAVQCPLNHLIGVCRLARSGTVASPTAVCAPTVFNISAPNAEGFCTITSPTAGVFIVYKGAPLCSGYVCSAELERKPGTETVACKLSSCTTAECCQCPVCTNCNTTGGVCQCGRCTCRPGYRGEGCHERYFGCGNRLLEPGEQCDPPSACCDANCQFKPRGTLCRRSVGPCDIAERCTARGVCPKNRFVPDGDWCDHPGSPWRGAYCRRGKCIGLDVGTWPGPT